MKQKSIVIQYIIFSFIAVLLLLILTLFVNPNNSNLSIFDKSIIGIFFIISCLIGISLTNNPGWIKRLLKNQFQKTSNNKTKKNVRKREGHHPDCYKFKLHTIEIKNKKYCTGCLGISIGGIISIILMIIYIINNVKIPLDILSYLVISGFIIIGLVFIEIMLNRRKIFTHILLNSLLVISFFIIVVGITEITGSIIYGIICIILSFLWLDTRILISNRHHKLLCNNCDKSCKMY